MTADSLETSNLDAETLILVRVAALVAIGAPPVSYMLNLEAAGETGIDPEELRGVLAAVAPIVGTARVAAATGNIVKALAVELEVAELDSQDDV
jgi:alkylhydroperoxidase/carboxymuconolactone decarboxylase family protein YurZ